MSQKRTLIKILLPLLIIIAAVAGSKRLIQMKQPPVKQEQVVRGILARYQVVQTEDIQIPITATGTVVASRELDLMAEVSGTVTRVSPHLQAGAFVAAGELLFTLEDTDYKLAFEKALAEKARIRLDITTLENQARVAQSQWEKLHPGETPDPLTIYQPQLTNARAQLAAAEASIEQARRNIGRTRIYAPFAALVQSESIALGQYVRATTSIAHLVDSNQVEVHIPLPPADLSWLEMPGAEVHLSLPLGNSQAAWQGVARRTLGTIDPANRMATLVAEVQDPYNLKNSSDEIPLAVGSFVDATLIGITLKNAISLPRAALRGEDLVWLVNQENRLQHRQVVIRRKLSDRVILASGLNSGDKVIVSPLAGAADGMLLRATEQEDGQ